MMFGIHVRMVNHYGDYTTVSLSQKATGRIWLDKIPTKTAVNVTCEKCGKKYFIKYKSSKQQQS